MYNHPSFQDRTTSFTHIKEPTIFQPMECVRQVWAYPDDTCTMFFWKDDSVFLSVKRQRWGHLFLIMSSQEARFEKHCHLKCDNTVSGWNMIFWKTVPHPSFVLKMKDAHSSITSSTFYQTTVCTPDKTVFWIGTTIRTALISCVISTNRFIPIAPT